MKTKCKLIVVDDHDRFREGLCFLLEDMPNVQVIAEARDGREFINLLSQNSPDVVLMDINMPIMDGIEATEKALAIQPNIKVIALTMFGEENYFYKMVHAGANGFLLKESGSSELESAIDAVMDNHDYFSVDILNNIIVSVSKDSDNIYTEGKQIARLSQEEGEVLKLICSGMLEEEIARSLYIKLEKVNLYMQTLYAKTNTTSINSLVMMAIRHKLVYV